MNMDDENDDAFGFLRMESERMWRLGHEIGALAVLLTIGITLGTVDSQRDLGDAIVTLAIALPLAYVGAWSVVRVIDWDGPRCSDGRRLISPKREDYRSRKNRHVTRTLLKIPAGSVCGPSKAQSCTSAPVFGAGVISQETRLLSSVRGLVCRGGGSP